jgi:hypothetical protein
MASSSQQPTSAPTKAIEPIDMDASPPQRDDSNAAPAPAATAQGATAAAQPSPTTAPNSTNSAASAAAPDVSLAATQASRSDAPAPPLPPSAAPTDATAAQAHRAAAAPALQAASQIIRRFDGRTTSFDVRLDPVDLGRVDVRLEVGADRKVKANLAAEKQTTLAELVRAARDLERALNDAGLDVAENGVTFSLSGGGRDAPTPDGRANSGAGDERSASVGVDAGAATAPQRASLPLSLSRWSGARLDVWA